jgi:hypothetical protein
MKRGKFEELEFGVYDEVRLRQIIDYLGPYQNGVLDILTRLATE